eukprot:TRINITY_DN15767_c0_g1_i1.p1 TRINITY_DN15767_c0_g1~~TRINITY_DN15767_c0_g1_i1.p1  ORF type:complete len:51 (-),score=1.00 TRINITY_DN15767_c0_g1_i1:269-421(-)
MSPSPFVRHICNYDVMAHFSMACVPTFQKYSPTEDIRAEYSQGGILYLNV